MSKNEKEKSPLNTEPKINMSENLLQFNQEIDKPKNISNIISIQKDLIKENLLFDYKNVSPIKLYYKISSKFDIFLMIIASIITIVSGLNNAIKSSLLGEAIDNLATTVGTKNLQDDEYKKLFDSIESEVNKTIKNFLIYGAIIFIFNFLSEFLWLYSGLRQMQNLKIKYFTVILSQEQSWFEANNIFELGTKVQAQIESIQSAFGGTLRNFILRAIEVISGYCLGFAISWKLTLVLSVCGLPFIFWGFLVMKCPVRTQKLINLKMQQKAGGIAEELLYNIKTVASFANFDYEIKRYNKTFESNDINYLENIINPGIVQGIVNFGIYLGFAITCIYARTLIVSNYDITNINIVFTSGNVISVLFSIRSSLISLMEIPSILLDIIEACASASDFFSLSERNPRIIVSNKNLIKNREEIKGKIEFKNVCFSYNDNEVSDKIALNG